MIKKILLLLFVALFVAGLFSYRPVIGFINYNRLSDSDLEKIEIKLEITDPKSEYYSGDEIEMNVTIVNSSNNMLAPSWKGCNEYYLIVDEQKKNLNSFPFEISCDPGGQLLIGPKETYSFYKNTTALRLKGDPDNFNDVSDSGPLKMPDKKSGLYLPDGENSISVLLEFSEFSFFTKKRTGESTTVESNPVIINLLPI
jgi:hypothetical protein